MKRPNLAILMTACLVAACDQDENSHPLAPSAVEAEIGGGGGDAAVGLSGMAAMAASTQQCVTDAAWNAAVNGLGGTTNAGHAKALYRALLTFKQHERTNASLPAWPAKHGTEPTSTITAQEVRDARGSGTWGGWDHIIAALECIENEQSQPPAPVASFASGSSSAAESAGTRNITVNLDPAPGSAITLGYGVGGTATPDNDYTALSGSVSVSSGASSVTIPVAIADDGADENDETVVLTLTSGTGYSVGSPDRHTLTITDDDDPPVTTVTKITATPSRATIASGQSGRVSLTIKPETNRLRGYVQIRPADEAAARMAGIGLTGDNGGRFGEACGWNDPKGVAIGNGRTCHVDYNWPANTGSSGTAVLQFVEFTADDNQTDRAISNIVSLDLQRRSQQVDPFCEDPRPNSSGTITMKNTGGWPSGVDERAGMSGGIEIEVDICSIGSRIGQTEIDLSDEGTGICVDHLKIDGWTRKDLPGHPVRWCGLIADGDGVKAGWTVEGNKSGKPDVYAVNAKGRITFRGTVRAYDDGVVRGDRTTRRSSLRAYFNRAVWNESGGHAQGDHDFVNDLPNMTVRDQDAATVSLERRFVYGGPHHGWNYVVDVDKPIVTGRSGDTSTPEYWTMAITAGGKGFWVRVPSGRTFSGTTHDALPLASLRANMGGTVRTMKEWCGRSESERGNMQYASVKVQGIAGPDASQISFSELAAGTDLCNP